MDKYARKPSMDPVQEKLRQTKATWNKEVSAFINDLINLKKMMNGWPSKFHMEKSFIKDPIPSDPASILGVLASDFQDITQRGNAIIEQQLSYSKQRKQKQPKPAPGVAPPAAPEAPAAPNLTQQLAASLEYKLVAEGSNPFTRLHSTLKGPWFGNSPEVRARKYRLSMLRTCTLLEKELKSFEAEILGSSAESIFISSRILIQIENHLRFLNSALDAFNVSQGVSSTPIPSLGEAEKVLDDFKRNYANFTDLDKPLVDKLSSLMLGFIPADEDAKSKMVPEILSTYKAILTDINQKHGTNATSLRDVLMAKSASLDVVAKNIVHKWLGKAKHNVVPFDKTSAIRLDLNKNSEEARETLDRLMNSLESGVNQVEIANYIGDLNKKFGDIKLLMRPLEDTIRNKLFDKTFLDLLDDKKLSDYSSNLSTDEKERLKRMIQTRQFRNMTQDYSRK